MNFTEKTRVQVPAIMHLVKLGYKYVSKRDVKFDPETNFITDTFFKSLKRINPTITEMEMDTLFQHIKSISNYDDLGRAFYKRLTDRDDFRLIDFTNYSNNVFNVMFEVPFRNGEEEFRPDVTLFINGMPLAFLEVKVPDNTSLIKAESVRMGIRFRQKLFNRFLNIIQIMTFSNNMEYEDNAITQPLQGTFYCTRAREKAVFSTFREKDFELLKKCGDLHLSNEDELFVLKDTNSLPIKGSEEYLYNLNPDRPTNRLCSSLFSIDRIMFLLNYGICYYDEYNEQTKQTQTVKHIMRYPQLFASLAIIKALNNGEKKGVIWHTQGSGKTELAYYQVKILTDYFSKKNIIPKFYFIVDRLSLFKQAMDEMQGRGLKVNVVNSKKEFAKVLENDHKSSGKLEMTVVNIQKFGDEQESNVKLKYDTNIQRIYFLDEAHRSYNVKGRFLANLYSSDKDAIKIALTGTPIVVDEIENEPGLTVHKKLNSIKVNTTEIFGNYIDTYYYDLSIKDGYTLRLIREDILTTYKDKIEEIEKNLKIVSNSIKKKDIKAHPKYCNEFTNYVINDFEDFYNKNKNTDDNLTVASMIVCESNEQAREVYKQLTKKGKKALLILYDVEDKEWRENEIKDFKWTNKYDYLVVDDMLLTGFDCKRVKKMYLCKLVKAHALLQTITRVNRRFGSFQYGYIVDFVDITEEFNKVNSIYANELKKANGIDDFDLSKLLLTDLEIKQIVARAKEALFIYNTNNLEIFQTQIDKISKLQDINSLKRVLDDAKCVYNVAKVSDNIESFDINIDTLIQLSKMVDKRAQALRFKEVDSNEQTAMNILNEYMELTEFNFLKLGEKELVLADTQREAVVKVKKEFERNFDIKDPKYIQAYEELKRILRNSNIEEISEDLVKKLNNLYLKIYDINNYNENLAEKYNGDRKFARIHKRVSSLLPMMESQLFNVLCKTKSIMDDMVEKNNDILKNEDYVEREMASRTLDVFEENSFNIDISTLRNIAHIIVGEYIRQYKGEAVA